MRELLLVAQDVHLGLKVRKVMKGVQTLWREKLRHELAEHSENRDALSLH